MGFALALSGGGIRGAAHLGALIALEEYGLSPTAIAGCSAGAIVAGLYACPLGLKEIKSILDEIAANYKIIIDPEILGILHSLLGLFFLKSPSVSGIIKGNKLEKYLEKHTFGKNISECNMPIVIPAVDLVSGKTIAFVNSKKGIIDQPDVLWVDDAPVSLAMSASAAVPVVFSPKNYRDMYLVDGGVAEMLPADLLAEISRDKILSIDVSNKYIMPENHNIIEIATHSFMVMSERLSASGSEKQSLLIKPDIAAETGLLSFRQINQCFEAGYQAVKDNIATIKYIFY